MDNPPAIIDSVTASNPGEMAEANRGIIAFCDRKVDELIAERTELEGNLAAALKNKWKVSGLKNAVRRSKRRVAYFKKIQSAVRQGFHIIPSFQGSVEIFAIRTDAARPRDRSLYRYGVPDMKCRLLPEGEGRYVGPVPYMESMMVEENGKEHSEDRATDIDEEIDFPFDMAKPDIMEITSRAMAIKLFDEIGILPERRTVDPIIVGRIKDPRSGTYNDRYATFMIAWHLDLNDL